MLKINLLPIEKRRQERTPLPRFLAILGGVAAAASLVVYLIFAWLQLGYAEADRDTMQADLAKPKTADIESANATLKKKDEVYKARKAVLDKIRPPFLWTEVLDLLCDKLDATHKKIWFEEIKAFEPNDLRMKQQETGFAVDAGLVVDGFSAGADPSPLLDFRYDVMQKPKVNVEASAGAKKPGRVMIDYFTGGIGRNLAFTVKEQNDFEEGFSQNFKTEFYIKPGATAPKPK